MVKVELYVPGIKSHEMVDIAHCEIVEGSRGKRHRLYGTYTDPATKKIHKVNSFATKAKYDTAVAEMTEGMPVEDITITQVSHFAEDSPLEADASELGGPTEPDNAGVPADVGGDESVPMGDEPSNIDSFEAESAAMTAEDGVSESIFKCRECNSKSYYVGGCNNVDCVDGWCEDCEGVEEGFSESQCIDCGGKYNYEYCHSCCPCPNQENFGAEVGTTIDDAELSADTVGEIDYEGRVTFCDDDGKGSACEESYCHRCTPLEGCTIHEKCQEIGRFDAESKFDNLAKEIAEDYREKGKSPEEAMKIGKATAAKIGRAKYGNKKFAKMGKSAEEADLTGIIVQDNDPSSPPDGIFASDDRVTRPEAYDKVYNAIDFIKRNNLTVTLQAVGNELHDDGYMTNDEKEAFYYIMDQKNAETSREVRSWESIAMDMISPDNITSRDLNAEMTLREWGESEIEESKHDFAKNPNEPFREWLDEEVKTHGDITFKEWADEEETETMSAEQITKSAESDTNQNTIETQVAVGLGIPPEIWLSMPRSVQDEYISSMDLNVMYIRELAQNGVGGYNMIMSLANSQKQNETSGDLSLIECNVCGISASQLLQSRGGVCEITDPMLTSAGEANPNYLKGVSCPFEKYYSLTQAVDNAVDREREENRTVIQLVTPRSVAYAAEELLSVTKASQALNTFAGQRISKHAEDKIAGTYECYCSYCAGVVELDADECPHCGTVDFDITDGGRVNYPSYSATDANYKCSCETPRPRHAGVHPTVCQYCNLIIEDDFGAESWSGKCQRCGVKSNASTMSWFNTDLICMDCADKEKSHPKYQEAKDRENEEVRKGNLNYEGIGFDAETFDAARVSPYRILDFDDYMDSGEVFRYYDGIVIQMTDDEATIDNAKEIIDNLVDEHGFDEYAEVGEDDKDLTIYFYDMGGNTLRTLSYNVKGNKANNAIIEWFSDYDYPVGGYTADAETFNSDSWDNLYVVAENQAGGWEACQVTNGVLQTYSNQDDAEREAKMTIDDLNSMYDWDSNHMELEEGQVDYDEDSWAGMRLSEVGIADNVDAIKYPNGQTAPYPPGRSANTGHHLEATRGIDTFTEPFENESPVNRLQVVGILAAAVAVVLIAKRL